MKNKQYLYQCMLDDWTEEEAFYCAACSCKDALSQFSNFLSKHNIRCGNSIACFWIRRVQFNY